MLVTSMNFLDAWFCAKSYKNERYDFWTLFYLLNKIWKVSHETILILCVFVILCWFYMVLKNVFYANKWYLYEWILIWSKSYALRHDSDAIRRIAMERNQPLTPPCWIHRLPPDFLPWWATQSRNVCIVHFEQQKTYLRGSRFREPLFLPNYLRHFLSVQ